MPLTVDDFLALDPELLSLRRSLNYVAPESHDRRRLLRLLAEREAQARQHWASGLAGWMTADEAAVVVVELLDEAARHGRVAVAAVRDDQIVFSGATTEHALALSATSPVRAHAHWRSYLEACLLVSAPPVAAPPSQQLDLLDDGREG